MAHDHDHLEDTPAHAGLGEGPSGAIAQGPGAQAVGAGGVIAGDVSGTINTGIQTALNIFPPSTSPGPADAASGMVASAEGRKLYRLLDEFWSMDEIEGLCFEMGLDYENLRGETKAGKARALVLFVEATGRRDELKRFMRVQRPNLRDQLQ